MFEKSKTIKHDNLKAYFFKYLHGFKRIKLLTDNSYLILENSNEDIIAYRHNMDDGTSQKFVFVDSSHKDIVDYHYVNGHMYIYFTNYTTEWDEVLDIYRSDGEKVDLIESLPRESYQHDMNYFNFYVANSQLYLIIIRHNRIHKYMITDELEEIHVIQNMSCSWYLSAGYILSISTDDRCELYDNNLELVAIFESKDRPNWIEIAASEQKDIVAIAMITWDKSTTIYVYDKNTKQLNAHKQRYDIYSIAVIGGRVWTTVTNRDSTIDGMMVFDKEAALKYSILRDKVEGDKIRAYQPSPITYECVEILELPGNKIMFLETQRAVITDITCRELEVFEFSYYECLALSDDKHTLAILNLADRSPNADPEVEYEAEVDLYEWKKKVAQAEVIDINTFRR